MTKKPPTSSTLPPSIRIGPYDIPIRVVNELKSGDENCWGLFTDEVIYLHTEQPSDRHRVAVLLHEALHSVWGNAGLGKKAKEEPAVHAIAIGLMQMFRDNRWLLRYIERCF